VPHLRDVRAEGPGLAGKCGIVTSYRPSNSDIKGEDAGEGKNEKLLQYDIYRKMLADHFGESEDSSVNKVEQFEDVKRRFIKEPGQMKLLIVVDKLLTGFDAPPATYLYIDKEMRDHGLFQAICRVNRLDSEDKEYGYIVDYKDLFKSLETSIHDYTGEAFEGYDAEDVKGLLTNRLTKAKERLEDLLESVRAQCEPVEAPKDSRAYQRYFCAKESGTADELEDNERKRVTLYKTVGALVRAYADLANEMTEAGYTEVQAVEIKDEVAHYENLREEIKLSSGDYVDMKMYEPAMRHLLDTYINADESKKLSAFDDLTLVQLIVEKDEGAVKLMPEGLQKDPEAMAEAIENNVRRLIIDEMPVNPKYFEKMSELLEALIKERKEKALHYTAYLEKIAELAKKVEKPETTPTYPATINTGALRAFYDNLDQDEDLALKLDAEIRKVKKADWRGNRFKEREIRAAIRSQLGNDEALVDQTFAIVEKQREY
jgi:type I restriction enzyme R subunit